MRLSIFACFLALAGACAAEPALDAVGSSTQALEQDNGMRLNGMRLNGMRLNGMRLNGMRLNGMRLNGMRLNGSVLSGYVVTGTDRQGNEIRRIYAGADLVGAILVGLAEDGSEVSLRIDSYRTATRWSDRDIHYYGVSAWDPADTRWEAACGTTATGSAIEAIPVPGVWDMSEGTPTGGSRSDVDGMFTFGCRDTAIGECVEWGYKPWRTVNRCDDHGHCTSVPGADYHQTCTRLVRADFCGDGTPWTQDGTPINVYDDVGIEDPDTADYWRHEADWAPAGATCMSGMRVHFAHAPACAASLYRSSCGRTWPASTLIMTDYRATSGGHHDD
jgi:hypothetical protein